VTKKTPDLRSFLELVQNEAPDQILEINAEVPLDYSSTAMALELERRQKYPILQFKNITNTDFHFLANVCASRDLVAKSIQADMDSFYDIFGNALKQTVPAQIVDSGPVQEIVVTGEELDLEKLPIPRHFSQDAGPYITGGMLAARDPDTGIGNLSYIRLQVKGRRQLGASLHSRQHTWDYMRRAENRGEDLPVAVVIGAHPAVMLAAAAKMGIDQDEYDLVGALLGQPLPICRGMSVDVNVPASAEIVIEGKLLAGVREPEGPFAEYTGYLTGRSTENVLEVSAITMRKDAHYVDVIPGNSMEHLVLGRISKEAWVHQIMKEALPFFKGFYYPPSGTHYHCYIQIEKSAEGQAKQAAQLLVSLDHYVKLVIVVDKDIDPSDQDAVLWALATRMQADKDVTIISNTMCNQLDPSSKDGLGAKMLIDATRATEFTAVPISVPDDVLELVRSILNK